MPARTIELGGLALALVLIAAKLAAAVTVSSPPLSEWSRLFATDAAVAMAFGVVARVVRARAFVALLYVILVAQVATTTALVQAIGSPLSAPRLAGLDTAMGDSAGHYLSLRDLAGALAVVATAIAAPFVSPLLSVGAKRTTAVLGVLIALPAWFLGEPALPAHRNALVFFVKSALVPDTMAHGDFASRGAGVAVTDPELLSLRGRAAGRHVVVVVLESVASRFLWTKGASPTPMPFLESLAARSLVATDAYASYPESIKGQVALFHAVHPAPSTDVASYARVPVPGLATLFAERGYATGLFHSGRFRFLGMEFVLARSGFQHRADAATIGGVTESSFGVDEESTVDALLHFVDARGERPCFTAYLPVAGHHPYDSPPGGPFPYDTQLGCYRNALHYADRAIERLWRGRELRGLAQQTLLGVVGEQGQACGEHGGNYGHTVAPQEENRRVPLLFHAPGAIDMSSRVESPVSHVDLAPTILDLCGLPTCAGHEGSSMLRVAGRPALFFADWGASLIGVRDGDWKLIHDRDTVRDQLFDVVADPRELDDRAADQLAVVTRLRNAALGFFGPRTACVSAW